MSEAPPDEFRSAVGSKWKSIDSDPVSDDTRIVRYMKLSTFLMLLYGRVFLPNLRKLQDIDANEGGLPSYLFGKYYGHHLRDILEPHENWLLGKAEGPGVLKEPDNSRNYAYFRFLADIWLAELGKRRCVWCWNRYEHESHALWQLYGQRGVLLHTTVGRVKQALEKAGPLRGLVAAVSYAIPRRMLLVGEDTKPIQSMTRPGFLECPYVYKEIGYNFEREIRLIFGINPDLSSQKPNLPGIIIELDFWKLLRSLPGARIEVSPETPEAERSAIATVFRSVQAEQEERQPEIQRHPEQQATASESPFTMLDEPQGLFPDLG